MPDEKYDSRPETYKHKQEVARLMGMLASEIIKRATQHDDSKLSEPEVSAFDEATPKLKGLKYNSPEYKQSLEDIRPALDHHYANNRHHPEHFPNGVNGMTLVDVAEMFCDWMASCKRVQGGNILYSLEQNKQKFQMPDMMVSVMKNTAEQLENSSK